jgi:hypothetical protein
MGGFGGVASGVGFGEVRPDVPSIRPWVTVNGNASKELNSPIHQKVNYGVSIAGGLTGSRSWARTALVGSYTAGGFLINPYTHFGRSSGISQVVGMQVIHQVSRGLSVAVRGFGGSSNGGYGVGAGLGGISFLAPGAISPVANPSQGQVSSGNTDLGFEDFSTNGLVDDELFDTRVNFGGVNGGVSYTPDGRNMFSFNAGASLVRRSLEYLVGMNSVGAGASYGRMLTPGLSTGASYRFGQFSFPGYYGGNQVHNVAWNLGYRINPATRFTVSIGGFQYQVNRIGSIALPRELAAILGQSQIQQVVDVRRRGFSGGASISRSLRVGGASLSYFRGANPGNGLFFASQRELVSANYSVGTGRFSFGTSTFFSRSRSLASVSGSAQNKGVVSFFSARIIGALSFTSSAGHRWIEAGALGQRRTFHATAGIGFSPGTFPMWF